MVEFNNIWEALFEDKAESENLRIRSELIIQLSKYIKKNKLTQKQAAEKFEVTQPRVSNIVNGKIDKFTIDMLINMLSKAGAKVDVNLTFSNDKSTMKPWLNFHVIEGGKRRKSQKQKADWDASVHTADDIQHLGLG